MVVDAAAAAVVRRPCEGDQERDWDKKEMRLLLGQANTCIETTDAAVGERRNRHQGHTSLVELQRRDALDNVP